MRRVRAYQAGFTLIEIMLVVLILGILLAVATATFLNQQDKAQDTAVETSLTNATHAATYTFTSNGKNVFPSSTISQLQHSEPELNITCSQAYVQDQVSAYFKDASNCTPDDATILDLRAVSKDGTDYVEQLDYTGKQRRILRLKGTQESMINYLPDPGFESASTPPHGCSYQDSISGEKVLDHATTSAEALDGNYSVQLTPLDVGAITTSGNTNAYTTIHCDANFAGAGAISAGGYVKAPVGTQVIAYIVRKVNGLYSWNAGYPGGVSNTYTCTSHVAATGDWQPVSCSLQPYDTDLGTPTGVEGRVGYYGAAAGNMSNGVSAYVDDMSISLADTMPPYFDGSFPDAVWGAAANNSISTGYAWSSW